MNNPQKIIVFTLERQLYGLPLHAVIKVLRAVEIRPVPRAVNFLSGVVNVHGEIIPVVDIRRLIGLNTKVVDLTDRFIVVQAHSHPVIINVDDVNHVIEYTISQPVSADHSASVNMTHIKAIIKHQNNLILILDLERLLSYDDVRLIEMMAENGSKIA